MSGLCSFSELKFTPSAFQYEGRPASVALNGLNALKMWLCQEVTSVFYLSVTYLASHCVICLTEKATYVFSKPPSCSFCLTVQTETEINSLSFTTQFDIFNRHMWPTLECDLWGSICCPSAPETPGEEHQSWSWRTLRLQDDTHLSSWWKSLRIDQRGEQRAAMSEVTFLHMLVDFPHSPTQFRNKTT